MVECNDPKLLEKYMKKYHIQENFSTPGLPFKLYRYEVGEMMNILHPQEQYLKFIVDGRLGVDTVDSEGNLQRIVEEKAFVYFGEVEILGRSFSNHFHEVLETVYSIELPWEPLREILWNDLKFLQFLVKHMSRSLFVATNCMEEAAEDVQSKLLRYIRTECEDQTFSGMEATAKRLRCSRRQLQRVVSLLVDQGVLVKIGWGTYTIK
jgi:hypothetical protein